MQAIIFDLFETLVTEWGRPKYTAREIAADLNVDLQPFRREREALGTAHFLGEFPDFAQLLETILQRLDITRDKNLLEEIARRREECKRKCFDVIEPKIIDMLQALKDSGCKLGLISNASPEEIGAFWDSGLPAYFDAIVMSCDVGMVKPDVKIYEHCLALLQADPANCLFIGDGGSNELDGAKAAGLTPLRAVWFTKHHNDNTDTTYPVLQETSDLWNGHIALL